MTMEESQPTGSNSLAVSESKRRFVTFCWTVKFEKKPEVI